MSQQYAFSSHLHFLNIIINNCEDIFDTAQIYTYTPIATKTNVNKQIKRLCVDNPQKCKNNKVYCTICCEIVKPREFVRNLPCHHSFHKKCVDKWFVSSMKENEDVTCPVCRKQIELNF